MRLGYRSLLRGAAVKPDIIETVGKTVGAEPSVTDNYEREGDLDLWSTVTTETETDIEKS